MSKSDFFADTGRIGPRSGTLITIHAINDCALQLAARLSTLIPASAHKTTILIHSHNLLHEKVVEPRGGFAM